MSRVVRVLSTVEAADNCCFANECDADPCFEVVTGWRTFVACEAHVDELVQPAARPTVATSPERPAPGVRDIRDTFKAEDALERVKQEIRCRAFGATPDPRYDPILDSLLDLEDTISAANDKIIKDKDSQRG